jgi:hypothetical protein
MTGFINTFVYSLSYSQSVIALPLIYPLHKSLGHAVRFLATDLSQELSLQITTKSSCHFLQLPIPKIRPSSLPTTVLYSYNCQLRNSPDLQPLCTDPMENSLYCWRNRFTAPLLSSGHFIVVTSLSGKVCTGPLPSNGLRIVACTCVAGMRLPSRCLAMGIHITIPNRSLYALSSM